MCYSPKIARSYDFFAISPNSDDFGLIDGAIIGLEKEIHLKIND
jgi:hypothetical protein